MMEDAPLLMMAEPLVGAQQPLGMQLLAETHQSFAKSAQAADCPRRRPRTGQQLGGVPALPKLAFTRFAAAYYDASAQGGALLDGTGAANDRVAVCAGHVMRGGRHVADFTIVRMGGGPLLGLALAGIDVTQQSAFSRAGFWGIDSSNGKIHGLRMPDAWEGQEGFNQGDVVGLLLDCDAGTLTVKKNGRRLGVALTGLAGEFCWVASMASANSLLRIAAADPGSF
jgi:hypothetical protein